MIADPNKKSLIIVESPTKAKTIKRYLPSTCIVKASKGHVVDLNKNPDPKTDGKYGVFVDNGFTLSYVIDKDKEGIVSELKKDLKGVEQLILASDEDREGESIAWHLYNQLQPKVPVYRMVFHEITKKAITEAFSNCRDIDMNLVQAQEARRAVDRLQGYGMSPILSQKLGDKYSAGRVQSPALKLIVEKENTRRSFMKSQFSSVDGSAILSGSSFATTLTHIAEKQVAVSKSFDSETGKAKRGAFVLTLEEAEAVAASLEGKEAQVTSVTQTDKVEKPSLPFTTSTLQQDATRKLGKSGKQVMEIAQRLYENGFITYMRTDSPTLSNECLEAAREYIQSEFGASWYERRQFTAKTLGAQEAHEAIRPAGDRFRTPEETGLKGDDLKLYTIIWKRTIASQMKPSIKAVTSVRMQCGEYTFASSGSVIKYEGFRRIYTVASDNAEEKEEVLPSIKEGDIVTLASLTAKSHETQPPQRYTEATLIQKLESEEIGRPSTYATIISVIVERGYVVRQGTSLVPTFTGFFVCSFLEKTFNLYIDYDFTKKMEAGLDSIARGDENKVQYLSAFWFGGTFQEDNLPGLSGDLDNVKKNVTAAQAKNLVLSGLSYTFDHDGKPVHYEIKTGKFGPYILSDLKEGENGKDMMRSIPPTVFPGTFSDKDAERILFPEAEPQELLYGKYEVKSGRYGQYIKRVEDEKSVSWPDRGRMKIENAPEAYIEMLFELPKVLGTDDEGNAAELRIGPYGFYCSYKGKNLRITDPMKVTFEDVLGPGGAEGIKGEHEGKTIELKSGRYGAYIKWGDENIPLPAAEKKNPSALTLERIIEIASASGRKADGSPKATGKEFTLSDGSKAYLTEGRYGAYLKWGSENVALTKELKDNLDAMTDQDAERMVEAHKAKPKDTKRPTYRRKK